MQGLVPDTLRRLLHRSRRQNDGDHDNNAEVAATINVTTAPTPNLPFLNTRYSFEEGITPLFTIAPTPPRPTIHTTNAPSDVPTQPVTVSTIPITSNGTSPFAPRRQFGKSQLYDIIADKYRHYQPGVDTLSDKDPRPEAFKKLTAQEKGIFFKKLTAHQRTTLIGQLTPNEGIELAMATHMAMLDSLLADADIRSLSRQLASQHRYNRDPELMKELDNEIYAKLVLTTSVSDEDLLTEDEQMKFLTDLHKFAPKCEAQGWLEQGMSVNAKEALENNPDAAKGSAYMIALAKPNDSVKSRLTLCVAPRDALGVVREIVRLLNVNDSSIANTSVLKTMGPAWQGKRYDSVIVNFAGYDHDGAKTLAAKLCSALPNVNWLKADSLILDEISEGCGYGETYMKDTSLAEEHTKIFLDTLLEIGGGTTTLTNFRVLLKNLIHHKRNPVNPALVQHAW